MSASARDAQFSCDKCPRTFKLEEFFEKHKKVHELKKHHRCDICGFVYGAAKGLEGHRKTHSNDELDELSQAEAQCLEAMEPEPEASSTSPPYDLDFHFLNHRGALAQAIAESSEASVAKDSSMQSPTASVSVVGTGEYKVYASLPDLTFATANEFGLFHCFICEREFSGINSLKKHFPIHSRHVQHACNVCGHVFGKKEYLMDHVREHTGEVSPTFQVCGQTLGKMSRLEHFGVHQNYNGNEELTLHSMLPFRCHICREVFQHSEALASHLSSTHRNMDHVLPRQIQPESMWCPICNQDFTRPYNLKVHLSGSHSKEFVENNFSNAEEFDAMLSPSSQLPATREADEPLQMKPSINQHYFDQKTGMQVLSCDFCKEKFVQRIQLIQHLKDVHCITTVQSNTSPLTVFQPKPGQVNSTIADMPEPPIVTTKPTPSTKKRRPGPASKTNAPPEIRATSSYPGVGREESTTDGSSFKCQECGMMLQRKQSFSSHVRVAHGNHFESNKSRGHNSIVDKILEESIKLSLKKHKISGKGGIDANAVQCSVCEQAFPNLSSLRDHVVNVHIQGQNHACDLCGKAFLSKENLNAHIQAKHPNLNKHLESLRGALGSTADEDVKQGLAASDSGDQEKKEVSMDDDDAASSTSGNPKMDDEVDNKDETIDKADNHESSSLAFHSAAGDVEDDVRYEPIKEPFFFKEQLIYPCYVALPYVTDEQIKALGKGQQQVMSSVDLYEEDPEELTIDERSMDDMGAAEAVNDNLARQSALHPPTQDLHQEMEHCGPTNTYDAEKSDNSGLSYPKFHFSLPFSHSSLWKKKLEVLPPETIPQLEMKEKMEEIKHMNAAASEKIRTKPKSKSKQRSSNKTSMSPMGRKPATEPRMNIVKSNNPPSSPSSSTQAMDYETQIQNDIWPLDCIKCNTSLGNLGDFNVHMNDHWSDDKCCPVCGLLINSKRFNFKQHLKIHTGEKPFTCKMCNRSFRQKAHMVKHITTHRTMGNGGY